MNFNVLPLHFAQRTQQSDYPQHTAEDTMLEVIVGIPDQCPEEHPGKLILFSCSSSHCT